MVTISGMETRKNSQGESFLALILEGDLIFVQSKQTGKLYATAHRVSIPSTFKEDTAQKFVGRQLQGIINKVEAEPYEYTLKSSGEVVTLTHSYIYNPNPSNLAEVIGATPEM